MLKTTETKKPPTILMRSIGTLYLASEAPKTAHLVVRDSSRGSPMTDAELKASIYAKGIIHPLIWKTYQGKDYVIAGNRRLRFLREIFADALETTVQTQDVEDFDGDWREIAGDTNLALPPHLVERYELIVSIAKDMKLSEAEVCARYGMSDQQYHRVMALGKMAEVVRAAWKAGTIDAKMAQLFTLESDPKEQEKIFTTLSKAGRLTDWDLRQRIVPKSQREISNLVSFVGLPAIDRAGLIKQKDFFATDTSALHILTDTKALNKMVDVKLAAKCKELIESGWKWAVRSEDLEGHAYQYGSIEPKKVAPTAAEKARLKEIEALLNSDADIDDEEIFVEEQERIEQAIALRGFTPQQMAKSGCILRIARDGSLNIEYGRIKPAEKKQVQAAERPKVAPKPKKPGVVTMTNALAERLSLQLEQALAEAIKSTPNVAVAALIAGFASDGHVIDVGIAAEPKKYPYNHGASNTADEKNFVQAFEGALKATPEARVVMLTQVVAEAVAIQIHNITARKWPTEDRGVQALVAAMNSGATNKSIAEHFDAKGYFDSVDRQACIEAVRCSMGVDHASKVAKMKKGEAAKFAAAHVPEKGWLPKLLRTVHYTGPVEAVTAKKPKPTKKAAKKKSKK